MLVNLYKDVKKEKRIQQKDRYYIRDVENRSDQKMATAYKHHLKKHPFTFNTTLKPYTPDAESYTPDTRTDFTGVYFCDFYDDKTAINSLTSNHVLESLVDFGCVDNASQAIEAFEDHCRFAEKTGYPIKGNHVIIMKPMRRDRVYSYEEAMGSFRWHKNGGYLGKADSRSEYFLSEPDERLKLVYLYTVLKVI